MKSTLTALDIIVQTFIGLLVITNVWDVKAVAWWWLIEGMFVTGVSLTIVSRRQRRR